MSLTADSLPDDVATLKAMLIAADAARLAAEVKAQNAEAEAKARALLIEQMKFTIAKLRHEQYGQSSERGAVLEQLELQLADLEEDASESAPAAPFPHVLPLHRQVILIWKWYKTDITSMTEAEIKA